MSAELIILGCGHSGGVPGVGNNWGVCDPDNPKNRRTRPSICLRNETTCIVVDTGPDFVMQCNRAGLDRLDAVLYTHAHGDHINGIDDLRNWKKLQDLDKLPVFGLNETLNCLQNAFPYMFQQLNKLYPAVLEPCSLENTLGREHLIGDIPFTAFLQDHRTCNTLGFRFGNVGYSTDMVDLDAQAIDILRGIDIWIADGAGYKFSRPYVHANIERIMALNEEIGASEVYFTHLSERIDYQSMQNETPEGYSPAHDGLTLSVTL